MEKVSTIKKKVIGKIESMFHVGGDWLLTHFEFSISSQLVVMLLRIRVEFMFVKIQSP